MTQSLVLVTGFGPFGDVLENPSGLLAEALESASELEVQVAARVLPVTFADAPITLRDFVADHEESYPRALLSLGVHPGAGFRLERIARAHPTSTTADTSGRVGTAGNPTGISLRQRSASFDIEALHRELAEHPVRISEDAGGYVCDWVYQHLLAHGERLQIPALFLHVPPLGLTPLTEQLPFVRKVVHALAAL